MSNLFIAGMAMCLPPWGSVIGIPGLLVQAVGLFIMVVEIVRN